MCLKKLVACGKFSRNGKLDKFASTPGQRYHRRHGEPPTLTYSSPVHGPFRGAFNVAKTDNGGFEENSTVLLVVFIVVLQNVTRIKVPRLECAMLIPSIPSILNTFTNGNGHAPIPMRSNGGFFARWMGHKMLHHHTGPVGGCEKNSNWDDFHRGS